MARHARRSHLARPMRPGVSHAVFTHAGAPSLAPRPSWPRVPVPTAGSKCASSLRSCTPTLAGAPRRAVSFACTYDDRAAKGALSKTWRRSTTGEPASARMHACLPHACSHACSCASHVHTTCTCSDHTHTMHMPTQACCFLSDARVPHEVLPSHAPRYAVSV